MIKLINRTLLSLALIVPLAIGSYTAFAADTTQISLSQALASAEKTDKTLALYRQKLDIEQNQLNNFNSTSRGNINTTAGQSLYINYVTLNNNIKNDKRSIDDYIRTLDRSVKTTYLKASNYQDSLNGLNQALDSINKKIDIANVKLNLGQIKQSDITTLELQKQTIQANIDSTKRTLDTTLQDLLNSMGMDISQSITVDSYALSFVKYDDTNVDSKIATAAKNSYSIVKLNQTLELSKLKYKQAQDAIFDTKTLTSDTLNLTSADVAQKQAQIACDNAADDNTISIWNEYNTLKSAEDSVAIEKLNLQIQETQYNTLLAQQKVNKATDSDVFAQQVNVIQERTQLCNAINTYMLEADKFNDMIVNP